MSSRIPDTHAEAWALLPWLANGRIEADDREWVEAHVQGCADCRAELAAQRLVATQITRDVADTPPSAASGEQQSFNKLWARIEAAESASQAAAGSLGGAAPAPRSSRTVRWLVAAVVVQALGLAVLGLALRSGHLAEPVYKTVADPLPRLNAPAVRLVFTPGASMGTVNTLLTHQGLSLVAGPGSSGNYTAELSSDAVASGATADSVAAVMAKDPNVTFSEPIAK
jgi:hypothetical protein